MLGHRYDPEHSNQLSFAAFRAIIKRFAPDMDDAQLMNDFNAADADGSGYLDKAEIKKYMVKYLVPSDALDEKNEVLETVKSDGAILREVLESVQALHQKMAAMDAKVSAIDARLARGEARLASIEDEGKPQKKEETLDKQLVRLVTKGPFMGPFMQKA